MILCMKKHLKTVLLGIYAGLAIALGGLLNILSNAFISGDLAWLGKLLGSLLFPIGLTLVCFLGLNLFTGKIGYVLDNKKDYLLFLVFVYLGNLIGSLIAGGVCLLAFHNVDVIYAKALGVAGNKMASLSGFLPGLKVFAMAMGCGALVYIAVFFYKTFKNVALKVIGIFIPIALFVYLGFDHCIANMFYFTFAVSFAKPLSYLNILIATIGNSIGAIILNEIVKAIKKVSKH